MNPIGENSDNQDVYDIHSPEGLPEGDTRRTLNNKTTADGETVLEPVDMKIDELYHFAASLSSWNVEARKPEWVLAIHRLIHTEATKKAIESLERVRDSENESYALRDELLNLKSQL